MTIKKHSVQASNARANVRARVVLDSVAKKESSKFNTKNIKQSVQSDLKILKKFSFG